MMVMPAAAQLDSLVSPGKLIHGHAKLEEDCKQCHTPFKKADQTRLCLDCHKPIAADIKAGKGFHGLSREVRNRECRQCHSDHKGREFKAVQLEEAGFDHSLTNYPLLFRHRQVACSSCHQKEQKDQRVQMDQKDQKSARWRDAPSNCVACHRKDDVHKASLGSACKDCHSEKGWKDTHFDHGKTRFALTGKHAGAECKACHKNEQYKDTARDCLSCHRKDDAHKGRFGPRCENCHGSQDWKSTFNHGRLTRYALEGKHAQAKCESCHRQPLYTEKLPTACVACHRQDDVHKGSLGEKCQTCHKESGWKNTSFNHDRDTRFPLANKHRNATCGDCHKNNVREKIPSSCDSCHRKDDRHEGRYGKACETCHTDKGWKPSTFDHTRATRFALRGAHASSRCEGCHSGILYEREGGKLPGRECIACHRKDDPHRAQLGSRCESCHGELKWTGVRYDHNLARFRLTGSHTRAECKACHKTPAYKDAPMACAACHEKEDVHKRTLGGKCETCHNTRTWASWDFDHRVQARYPLEGAHARLACKSCHVQAAAHAQAPIPQLSKACSSCHGADDVHHGAFGQLCERCHQPQSWRQLLPGAGRSTPINKETK